MEKNYDVEQEPIVISKILFDILLKQNCFAELYALYGFYYYTAKWQKTNQPYATTGYVAKGMNWSPRKVQIYKKRLLKLGLVEDVVKRDHNHIIQKHYIKVRFIWTNKRTKVTGISAKDVNKRHR